MGHLIMLQLKQNDTQLVLHYECIKTCQNTEGCIAITFRESTNTCWLKNADAHSRRRDRAFLTFDCLAKAGAVVYPNYQELVDNMLKEKVCPLGYEDWMPNSLYCYKIYSTETNSWQKAQDVCRRCSNFGDLIAIDSKELNYKIREKLRATRKNQLMWIAWKFGKYVLCQVPYIVNGYKCILKCCTALSFNL